MGRRGKIPTKAELKASLLSIAAERYGGKYAPGMDTYNSLRPKGWAQAKTIVRHFEADNWGAIVQDLTGLSTAPPNSTTVKRQQSTEEVIGNPFRRVDDSTFSDGIAYYRSYTDVRTGATHYQLR